MRDHVWLYNQFINFIQTRADYMNAAELFILFLIVIVFTALLRTHNSKFRQWMIAKKNKRFWNNYKRFRR